MTKQFLPIDGFEGVLTSRLGKLSSAALQLLDGSLCLYSPVAGLEQALAKQVDELGPVSAILAPNHYHNKGLAAHAQAFPNAALYCSDAARPRLSKITGMGFAAIAELQGHLPDSVTLHEPEGLKTGEVWVEVATATDRMLIVTDAFSAEIHPPSDFGTKADMLTTFPRYGVKDASTYKAWAIETLSKVAPTILLPCHGSPVRSDDITSQLIGLLREKF